jgi:hypothetical protein
MLYCLLRCLIVGTRRFLALFGCAALVFAVTGCFGGKNPSPNDPEAAHIIKVGDLVMEYETAHKAIPPANLDELKDWALNEGKALDKDFLSTRDNEPYVVEVSGGGKPKKGSQIMVYESTGKSGKKYTSVAGSKQATEKPASYFGYMGGSVVKDSKKQQEQKRHEPKGQ